MATEFNIYCDESCHLEHDHQSVMLLGAVRCPVDKATAHNQALRAIKLRHRAGGELKWTKVSRSRVAYYEELIAYFFDSSDLSFRALVVQDKALLDHASFNDGSHDAFYYKMYFYLLRNMLHPGDRYRVFLDIKDTRSQQKINQLHSYLCNNFRDWDHDMLASVQHVRSHEVELIQLADFLLGAVSYSARNMSTSPTKQAMARLIAERAGHSLAVGTPPWEEKLNLFYFSPRQTVSS